MAGSSIVQSALPCAPSPGTSRSSGAREIFDGAIQGAVWMSISFGASKFLVFLSTVILARLLLPAQFGQVGFALVVIGYLETIGNFGVGAALIYEPRHTVRAANVSFTISLLIGAAWALVMNFAAYERRAVRLLTS